MGITLLMVRYAALGIAVRIFSFGLLILAAIGSGAVRAVRESQTAPGTDAGLQASPSPFTYTAMDLAAGLFIAPIIESMFIAIGCMLLRSIRVPPWLTGVLFALIGFFVHANPAARISGFLVFGICAWLFARRTHAFDGDPPLARRTRGFVENYMAIVALHFGYNAANITLTASMLALANLGE